VIYGSNSVGCPTLEVYHTSVVSKSESIFGEESMSTLLVIALTGIYIGGAIKFWNGFNRTNFSQNRLGLTVAWPFLLFNRSYRQNFNRALKG
jgi:hypothetical protein